jgi:hypothetical protein
LHQEHCSAGEMTSSPYPPEGAPARLQAVITTAALSETDKSGWCRSQGMYPAELEQWFEVAGIDARTLQPWNAQEGLTKQDGRPTAVRPTPSHTLSADERAKLLRQ